MGLITAFSQALHSALSDQWKDVYTARQFTERMAVCPGVQQGNKYSNHSNSDGTAGIITNNSRIFVPEYCVAFIFTQGAIEEAITQPGEYLYQTDDDESIFDNPDISVLFKNVKNRVEHGGMAPNQHQIAFVNLRELRGIKFGTRGPQIYNDKFYGTDLEVLSYGTFSIRICNPQRFIQQFVPAFTLLYSFDNPQPRQQLLPEFIHSFIQALNSLSSEYRISQLPSQTAQIVERIKNDSRNAGSWPQRFGIELTGIGIENIELSHKSYKLVNSFSDKRMSVTAYANVEQRTADIAAQQKIAGSIERNGFGDAGGLILGTTAAQSFISPMERAVGSSPLSVADSSSAVKDSQNTENIENEVIAITKLSELLKEGLLTQEEFDTKKKQILKL